jgi:hypothetical protein
MTTGVQQHGASTARTVTLYGGIALGGGAAIAGGVGAWNYVDGKHVASTQQIDNLRTSYEQAQRNLEDVLRPPTPLPNDDAVRAAAAERFGNDRAVANAVGYGGNEQPLAVQAFGTHVASDAASAIEHAPTSNPELARIALQVGDNQFLGAVANNAADPFPALREESKWVTVSDGRSIHSDTVYYHRATTGSFDEFRPLQKGVAAVQTRSGALTSLGTVEENAARATYDSTKAAWRSAVDDAAASPHQLSTGKNMFVVAGALAAVGAGVLVARQMGAFDNG